MAWMTTDPKLFTGVDQVENFRRMSLINPVRRVRRSDNPRPVAKADCDFQLPEAFDADGERVTTAQLLEDTRTTGFIVLHGGRMILERYAFGGGADVQTIAYSVTKSYVSTLIACALRDGKIESLEVPVDAYASALNGSGYKGVALRDVLQMSSGVRWTETYGDPQSDVSRWGRALAEGGSLDEMAASLPREFDPGTYNRYNSCDTHVLGMVLVQATGMSISDYLEQQLWGPVGMEDDSFFLVDGHGMEAAGMGLNATLRDHAKFGRLFLNGGTVGDASILPPGWLERCSKPAAMHLTPGPRKSSNKPEGYGYQWWLPDDSGAYAAIGIYHQYVWIDPAHDVVVAVSAADPRYALDPISTYRTKRSFYALFHAIGEAVAGQSAVCSASASA